MQGHEVTFDARGVTFRLAGLGEHCVLSDRAMQVASTQAWANDEPSGNAASSSSSALNRRRCTEGALCVFGPGSLAVGSTPSFSTDGLSNVVGLWCASGSPPDSGIRMDIARLGYGGSPASTSIITFSVIEFAWGAIRELA